MASIATRLLLSNTCRLPLMCTRSLTLGGPLKSSEVAPVGNLPEYVVKKFDGASSEIMEKLNAGYAALSPEDKALAEKVSGPWTELTMAEKVKLYDRQYEQSWYEEENERQESGYFKNSLLVWIINGAFLGLNWAQTEYCDMSEYGSPAFSRSKQPDWLEAAEFRYAKYNHDPITKNLGGFR